MLWWDRKGEFTWEWLLEPSGDGGTRLVNRIRETAHPWTSRMLYEVVAANGCTSLCCILLGKETRWRDRIHRVRRTPPPSVPASRTAFAHRGR